jgi:Cu2+-exporting ATPase
MRERARTAVKGLARLAARGAWVVQPDGTQHYLAVDAIRAGMTILLAAGDRVPVDARIVEGRSELDVSLVSGESLPQAVAPGALLQAGTLNLTGPLKIEAMAAASESFLAEMMRMMESAEAGRAGYRRLADRAARLYAPVIHVTAFAAFVSWTLATGDAHRALTIAIAVLIITCPCALGLAVPMVQVVAARRLFERGIMVKGGGALERLAEVDHVVFDKTGTLTSGVPELADRGVVDLELLAVAAAMAAHSRHPYSQAVAAEGRARNARVVMLTDLVEHAGAGLEGRVGDTVYRLGRPDWACGGDARPEVALSASGLFLCSFRIRDELRPGAREVVAALLARRIAVEILSGDHEEPVRRLASSLNVPWRAAVSPGGKVAHIAALAGRGHKVLMVGDGLNDAPSLAAAHVSMATASAADIGRNAADLVFLHNDLAAVSEAIRTADEAARLVRQNFLLAVVYNAFAVPVAVLGYVTPLIAAIAMSASSIAVICNALRLGLRTRDRSVATGLPEVPPARAIEAGG